MVQTDNLITVTFQYDYSNGAKPFYSIKTCGNDSKQFSDCIIDEILSKESEDKLNIEKCIIEKSPENVDIDLFKNRPDLERILKENMDPFPLKNNNVKIIVKCAEKLDSKEIKDPCEDPSYLDKAKQKERRALRQKRREADDKIMHASLHSSNRQQDPEIRYVGLVNQAMTCYLNSLLQALYMTPEFRNALYEWEYTGTEKHDKNIPFQLQKLFLNLQTSDKIAVETTALTHSFGWDSSEAWNQHDIQELCRVMFDALEQTFKNTKQADFINRLYEGKINDYVKCLTCNTEKSREDSFLDIPLPLRSFDSNWTFSSVEEALEAFVKYEILEGNNQYFCEKCNKKSNAHKGLKFTKFPYILTLQLKRFDFDHNTYHRIKLNDKVTFPDELNLNSFIASSDEESNSNSPIASSNEESPSHEEDAGMSVKSDESASDSKWNGTPMPVNNLTDTSWGAAPVCDDDEGIEFCNGDSSSVNTNVEKMRERYAKSKGPYIYELFCIMIHSGSASGGHYYAYIKDFRFNEWVCFDDQRVTSVTEKDIQNTYGGGTRVPYYSGAFRSSTNAYMLMYRQIDRQRNAMPMQAEDFPPHITDLLEKIRKSEEDRCNSYLHDKNPIRSIIVHIKRANTSELELSKYVKVNLSHLSTTKDVIMSAYKLAFEDSEFDPDRCRLVFYNTKYNLIERLIDPEICIDDCQYFERHYKNKHVFLEVREPNEEFEPCPSSPVITKVYLVDVLGNELIDGPYYVRGHKKQTIREYLLLVKKYMQFDLNSVCVLSPEIQPDELLKDDFTFIGENISETYPYDVCLTESLAAYKNKSAQLSAFKNMHDRLTKTCTFYIETSNLTQEDLEKHKNLKIPSIENYYREKKTQESVSNHSLCLIDEIAKIYVSSDKCKSSSDVAIDSTVYELPPINSANAGWALEEINNSEDSSLSDSDKTIVNEGIDDPESEAESFMASRVLEMQRSYINEVKNGETTPPDTIFKVEHLKKEKRLKITAPNDITEDELKERLIPHLKIPKNQFKILCNIQQQEPRLYFMNDRTYSIKLGRILETDESFVDIYSLRMCDRDPLALLFTTVLKKNAPIAKKQIMAELQENNCVDVPFERLQFYEVLLDDIVGDVIPDDDKFLNTINKICVQELPPSEASESDDVTVYVRRWNRSANQLDGPVEISVPTTNFSEELANHISALSNKPKYRLEFTVQAARKNFTENKVENFEYKQNVLCSDVNSRSYIIYRDGSEVPVSSNHEVGSSTMVRRPMNDRYTNTTFSRREKALKIHVDT